MKVIVRIDAAPGFEETVEAALDGMDAVFNVVADKHRNFDLVVGLQAEDANAIQAAENAIRHESGIQSVERITSPGDKLLERLGPG